MSIVAIKIATPMPEKAIQEMNQQALTLLKHGQLKEASLLYEEICKTDHANPEAWLNLGTIHGLENNHSKKAKQYNYGPGNFIYPPQTPKFKSITKFIH